KKVPAKLAPMPPTPVPGSQSKLCTRPSSQPVRTRGKVNQFGTLNFHQSMTAEATIAAQRTIRGQLARLNNSMGSASSQNRSRKSHIRSQKSEGSKRPLTSDL